MQNYRLKSSENSREYDIRYREVEVQILSR